MAQLLRQLWGAEKEAAVESICEQLRTQFALADTWSQRQSYAFLSGQLVACGALPSGAWQRLFLPGLVSLAQDRVPNVRIAVAKMLMTHVINTGVGHGWEGTVMTFALCYEIKM